MAEHIKAKFSVGDLVQTPYKIIGRRRDGVGRIVAVGCATVEIDGSEHYLGISYQVGTRWLMENQLKRSQCKRGHND